MKYFLLLIIPFYVKAQTPQLTEEELNPKTKEILLNKPEKYLYQESMIYNLDNNTGISGERYYTGLDRNRFSVAGHLSSNYEKFENLLGIEINFMKRTTRFNQIWLGLQMYQHQTYFNAISQNHPTSSTANTEGSFQRPSNTKNTLTALGFGLGYRFKFLAGLLNNDNVFETVDVFINGIKLDEEFINKTYDGFGLTTNYGIHKRSGPSFFYGGKFSYNFASVTRDPLLNEPKTSRSLSLGWSSIALEMGLYF
jgi:hypothetical protein